MILFSFLLNEYQFIIVSGHSLRWDGAHAGLGESTTPYDIKNHIYDCRYICDISHKFCLSRALSFALLGN